MDASPQSIDANSGAQTSSTRVGNSSYIKSPSEYLPNLPPSRPEDIEDQSPPLAPETEELNGHTPPTNGVQHPTRDAQGRLLNPRSCVTCRKRKVKCDKIHPCSNCNRQHIECVFPAPGRAPRRTKKVVDGRDKELLERLRRLEGVVKGLGVEVSSVDSNKDVDTPSTGQPTVQANGGSPEAPSGPKDAMSQGADHAGSPGQGTLRKATHVDDLRSGRFENRFGRLVISEGKSRYVNNSFWANLSNEVEDLKGILNQTSDDDDDAEIGANPAVANHQGWIFGFSSQSVDMLSLHPLPNQIPVYWDIFKDRVDPLVKMLHIPTIEPTVLSSASHLSNLSRGFEALLFAIYYAAVTSLTPQDCMLKLNEEKSILISRYRFAIEQSLARASFLTTEETVVVQAFVLFLICVRRNHDARIIWTLTGLVVRIAQTIGLHRDGSQFGLSPFETEMRRRLWWQVGILDTRASEDHGCDPTILEQSFDTKMPLNINDIDISPEMTEFPAERQGCTDMSFCLIRFEVASTFRRINYVPPGPPKACTEIYTSATLADKERWITECHQRLEERYLKHCDMSVPLFWVTATVARLMMSKMWLMVYHPFQRQDGGASLPSETKDKLFITSLENIEYALLLETESRTMKWGWLFRTYMQWHALAFILSELCHRTTGDLADRAWTAIERTRDGRWARPLDGARAGQLWRPLRKLYRKAKDARQRGLAEEQMLQRGGPCQAPSTIPVRTYSPNANPMFGHPKRPQMTRAPLSQAQLQRFVQGPSYGEVPLDKHELLKSPRGSDAGMTQAEPVEETPLTRTDTIQTPASTSILNQQYAIAANGQSMYAPTAVKWASSGPYNSQPPSLPYPSTAAYSPQMPGTTAMDLSGTTVQFPNPHRPNPFDLAGAGGAGVAGIDIDSNMLDPSGDMNWENWDELVKQFGMDVDTTFDRKAGDVSFDWPAGAQLDLDAKMANGVRDGGGWR